MATYFNPGLFVSRSGARSNQLAQKGPTRLQKINCEPALKKLFEKTAKQAKSPPGEAANFAKLANVEFCKRFGRGVMVSKESQKKLDDVIGKIKLSPQDLKDMTKAVKKVTAGLGPLKKTNKVDLSLKIVAGWAWMKIEKLAGTDKQFKDDLNGMGSGGGVRG